MFANCLNDAIARLKPTLIAEEQNQEWLKGKTSITVALARASMVPVLLCDPGKCERRTMGYRDSYELQNSLRKAFPRFSASEIEIRAEAIEVAREYGKREEFWIKSIVGENTTTTIFICGDAHIDKFRERLLDRWIPSEVIARELGMTEEQRNTFAKVKCILAGNPSIDVVDSIEPNNESCARKNFKTQDLYSCPSMRIRETDRINLRIF
jgi:hypothetical protein